MVRSAVIRLLVAGLGAVAGIGATKQAPEPGTTVVARAMQPGEVIRLDVTCRCGDAPPRVIAFGRDVPLFPESSPDGDTRWHGLIGIDLETSPGIYPLTVQDPERRSPARVTDLHVVAKAFPTRRLQVAAGFVNPPPSDLERISREAAALAALFTGATPRRWDGPFGAPVATGETSNFGSRSVFNGQARSPHGGVDYGSPAGAPVAAPAAGRIVLAEDLFFTGSTVVVDHGLGLYSLLAHLSTITVGTGDLVERGAMVGRVGATGRVTGPHLHWAIRLSGARVDPLSLLFAATTERTAPGAPPAEALSR